MSQPPNSREDGVQPGTILLGRYEIQERIASGGMAAVYRAHDELLNRKVAIKVMAPWLDEDESHGRRFSEEARAAAGLNHPNIVTIYDTLEDNGRRYIAMELVDGQPLSELIPVGTSQAVDIACQLAAALDYAHSRGIIHCDIKPQNVLIDPTGRPRLLDFGIARAATQTWAMATTILGTGAYMAPEVVEGGRPDERSDVYALATLLYEMISGRLPFEGDTAAAQTAQRLVSAPRPLSEVAEVPHEIEAAVMAALERDPDRRPQGADAFRESLSVGTAPAQRDDSLTAAVPVAVAAAPIEEPAPQPFEADVPVVAASAEPASAASGGDPGSGSRKWWVVPVAGLAIVACFVVAFLASDALFADDDDEPNYSEYFSQVQSTFDTFRAEHEQEAQQFGGQEGDDPNSNKQLYVDFLRAYVETRTNFVATLESIDPPEELEDEHQRYLESAAAVVFALDDFADQVEQVDAEAVRTLDIGPYEQAEENQIRACNALQEAATELEYSLELQCSDVEDAVRAPSLGADQAPAAADQAPEPVTAGPDEEQGEDDHGGDGEGKGNGAGKKDKDKDRD